MLPTLTCFWAALPALARLLAVVPALACFSVALLAQARFCAVLPALDACRARQLLQG